MSCESGSYLGAWQCRRPLGACWQRGVAGPSSDLLTQTLHLSRGLPYTPKPKTPCYEVRPWPLLCLILAGRGRPGRLVDMMSGYICEGACGREELGVGGQRDADGLPGWVGLTQAAEVWRRRKAGEGSRRSLPLVLRQTQCRADCRGTQPLRPEKAPGVLLGLRLADGRWRDFSAPKLVRANRRITIKLFLERRPSTPALYL